MNTRETACSAHAAACVLVIHPSGTGLVLTIWNERHGCFGLPGGKRETRDATIRSTAMRELAEETLLGLRTSDHLTWLHNGPYQMLPTSDTEPRDVHLYHARTVAGFTHPAEGAALAWMEWFWLLQSAKAFSTFYAEALPDGIAHLKPTAFV